MSELAEIEETYLSNLIDSHWDYVAEVLTVGQIQKPPEGLDIIEFHYKSAFRHGYKHGREDLIKEADAEKKVEYGF